MAVVTCFLLWKKFRLSTSITPFLCTHVYILLISHVLGEKLKESQLPQPSHNLPEIQDSQGLRFRRWNGCRWGRRLHSSVCGRASSGGWVRSSCCSSRREGAATKIRGQRWTSYRNNFMGQRSSVNQVNYLISSVVEFKGNLGVFW